MKIAHITSELCRKSAGLGVAVAGISSASCGLGNVVNVYGLASKEWDEVDALSWTGAQANVFWPKRWSGSFGYCPELLDKLLDFEPDIVHLHGLWNFASLATIIWHRKTGRPYVVSAHGMLTPVALQYSRYKKAFAISLFQKEVLQSATIMHATSIEEKNSYLDFGLKNSIKTIPLGMNIFPSFPIQKNSIKRRVLFLGRLHHKKGIDWLIDAWLQLENDFPDWELSVVGPVDPSYSNEINKIKIKCINKKVSFIGPLYGDEKLNYISKSELFILPSRSENFGLTIPESLLLEVPVIATKGTPWSGLETNNAGWWIEQGSSSLEQIMRKAMSLNKSDLHLKGLNGRLWIERDFSNTNIATQWQEVYKSLM